MWGFMGVIQGAYWGNIGIVVKKMEFTILYRVL